MQTIEIPRHDWPAALNEFGLVHRTWLVSLDVLDPMMGAQPEVHEVPLAGIATESDSSGGTLSIFLERSPAEHLTHTIHAPTHIRIERTDEGADVAMQIESADGKTTILTFRAAALPETVDGIVRL